MGEKETDTIDIASVLKHDKKRSVQLDPLYDPIIGNGSPIERFPFMVASGKYIYLPLEMKSESLLRMIELKGWIDSANELFNDVDKKEEERLEELQQFFHELRCKYDFEYWCATCVTIEDNMKTKVPFILNVPQRLSLVDLEYMRTNDLPVRILELKHRQYGSTTMKNAYAFWVQNVVYGGYSAYVCSLDATGGTKIVARYETIVNNYPSNMGEIQLKPYMGLRNTYHVPQTNSIINIGSAERPNAPSGDTIQVALISEAGKMKSTAAKGAHKLITNIMSMVQLKPHTFVMIESTAEESGAWFRSQVFKAQRGESGFRLTFISWVTDPRCQLPVVDKEAFIKTMTKYEWETLWENGATLDQIHWYRKKSLEYDNDWQMQQENPTTVEEAFAGAGKKVFTPVMIRNARETVCAPKYIGEIIGDDVTGPDSLNNIKFEDNARGRLKIWMHPEEFTTEFPVGNRYALYVDIGGTTDKSDYSVIKVIDRWPMIEGGDPECAAEWRGHIDLDILAWKSAQIGMFFGKGLLAVEYNALGSRGNNTDGIHYLTIFNEIGHHYPNLYTRENPSKVKERVNQYGFYLTHASKTMIVNSLKKAWRGGGYIEHSSLAVQEASFFETKEDGTMGAIDGEHDDVLISTGGAYHLAVNVMPPATYLKPMKDQRVEINEAVF